MFSFLLVFNCRIHLSCTLGIGKNIKIAWDGSEIMCMVCVCVVWESLNYLLKEYHLWLLHSSKSWHLVKKIYAWAVRGWWRDSLNDFFQWRGHGSEIRCDPHLVLGTLYLLLVYSQCMVIREDSGIKLPWPCYLLALWLWQKSEWPDQEMCYWGCVRTGWLVLLALLQVRKVLGQGLGLWVLFGITCEGFEVGHQRPESGDNSSWNTTGKIILPSSTIAL